VPERPVTRLVQGINAEQQGRSRSLTGTVEKSKQSVTIKLRIQSKQVTNLHPRVAGRKPMPKGNNCAESPFGTRNGGVTDRVRLAYASIAKQNQPLRESK
jgi:hypothetical protein